MRAKKNNPPEQTETSTYIAGNFIYITYFAKTCMKFLLSGVKNPKCGERGNLREKCTREILPSRTAGLSVGHPAKRMNECQYLVHKPLL